MKRLLCCIMALTMIGSATAFAAEPVDNSAIAEKALSEVTALYEDLYTITNAEAEVQNSTYDDMGNIIVDVVVSFDRTLKATCAEDMPYIQGLEIALTELTDPDEISAASAYIDAKKADLEDNYIGVAQDSCAPRLQRGGPRQAAQRSQRCPSGRWCGASPSAQSGIFSSAPTA